MKPEIDAVFIDLGNTMRILVQDEPYQANARQIIAHLVGAQESPEELLRCINERYKTYRKWAFETWIEAPEAELWTRWLLPDYPAAKISPLATELTYQFRQSMGKRILQPDARMVVPELSRRGYKLGIISNLIGVREIPDWLESDGFAPYFQSVVLSAIYGHRKPDPEVYWEAARRIGSPPARCAYVGDNPLRDVIGTRNAGFGMIILLMDEAALAKNQPKGETMPDVIIQEFKQILDIFPQRQALVQDGR